MIKINNLNKYYNKNKSNEIHVINDVTLELPSIGLISFLGASGSGKTTLLNVIGGLDKGIGEISYDSFKMKKYEMSKIDKYRNENFGYVFQTYNLLLNETVYDNLKIALELIDIYDENETNSRIEYALKSVGMYKYRKKKTSQLSGGQQQRVAIARALVKHCKVIIADEPTGNLDSANAIEVMNILKTISKKTLVLLVTHNETLANFYSDYIYKIEDGKIVSGLENQSSTLLDASNENVIYLKDINLLEGNIEGVNVKLYSNEDKNIDLEIVERNNTFYIRSNKKIKLLENSNIKLVNDHYKPVEKNSIDKYNYDDSFFNNSIKKRNVFWDLFTNFRRSFQSFKKPTKKIKIIYVSLVLLGILFSVCAVSISNAIKVDDSSINADENYHIVTNNKEWYMIDDGEILKNALKNGYISSVQMTYNKYIDFSYKTNYVEEKTYSESFIQLYYNDKVNKLLYGEKPKENEIAISLELANTLLEKFSDCCNSYEDLFELNIDSLGSKIVGIVEGDYKIAYLNRKTYLENITSHIFIVDNQQRYYQNEKKFDTYDIVMGRDLTDEDYNTSNILISDKFLGYEEYIGKELPGVGFVVGAFKMKNVEYSSLEIIANIDNNEKIYSSYKYSYEEEDYQLVEGRAPLNENECLVSINSHKQVGETFDGYKIVGKYNASTLLLSAGTLLSTSALSINDYTSKIFLLEDEEAFLDSLEGTDFVLKTMYQNEYDKIKELNKEKMTIFGILGGICLITASIMVFFLMRSKMINDIYNIGVYRSLGSSKFKIYLRYLTDTIVMVTFTSLISYVVVMFGYLTAIDSINDYFTLDLFSRSLTIPLLGVVILYVINIFFGLLPIFTLLKKTPSEIIAKYDI